jgi:hypothetical protein
VGVLVVGVALGVVVVVVDVVVGDDVSVPAVFVTVDVVVVTVEVTGAVPTCATSMVVGARPNHNRQRSNEDARVCASMAYQPLNACELIATRDARRALLLHQGWARRES